MKQTINAFLISAIILAVVVLQVGTPKPGPLDPVNPKDSAAIAQKVPGEIAALQAENYAATAQQLRDGKLKGETAAAEFLVKRNKAAIDAAYKPLDEHLQSVLGDDKYSDAKAAEVYEAIGQGFQKAGAK